MGKAQDDALIWQAAMHIELGKLAVQRGVEEGLFHCRVRQAEPLLHEVHPQHRLQRKGRAFAPTFGVLRCDELNERSPGNHTLRLGEKHLLAGHSTAQVQIKAGLFHGAKWLLHGLKPAR